MNKTSALVGLNDKIEELLSLLFEKEPLVYSISAYIYYFGLSLDDILSEIIEYNVLPISDKHGNKLNIKHYPKLFGIYSVARFNIADNYRVTYYRVLRSYGELLNIDNINAISLRKTWAYNEICKGSSYLDVKHTLSFRGSILSFFDYLNIDVFYIEENDNLRNLYYRGLLNDIERKLNNNLLSEAELYFLRGIIQ